jgi:hypothetical protein
LLTAADQSGPASTTATRSARGTLLAFVTPSLAETVLADGSRPLTSEDFFHGPPDIGLGASADTDHGGGLDSAL